MRPRAGRVSLTEPLKNVWQKLAADSDTVIAHCQFQMGIYSCQSNLSLAAVRCKLDRIGNQVPNDLLQTIGIAYYETITVEGNGQRDTFSSGGQLQSVYSGANYH